MDLDWRWLIPVLIVGSWILRGLLRSQEENPGRARRPVSPRSDASAERPARPVTDVDRFLEEINRLRRKSAEEYRAEAPRAAPPPVPPRRPAVRPATRQAPRPRPVSSIPEAVAARPVSETVFRPQVAEVVVPLEPIPLVRPAPVPFPGPGAARASFLDSLAPFIPTKMAERGVAPSLALLFALVSTREALGSAYLLREVLDAPLCKRRGRRVGPYS